MKRPLAFGRVILAFAGGFVIVGFIYMGPAEAKVDNDWALRVLATVLSVLAGILIAVITMLGDPRRLYPGNWRIASAHKRELERALNRFALLFWIYLSVIALIFVSAILEGRMSAPSGAEFVRWPKHIALSVGCAALLWSFSLPAFIRRAQLDRLKNETEMRRQGDREEPSES